MRVLVAMSGGVDSSAAAALLAEQGAEVVGISLRVHDFSDRSRGRSCCAPDDVEDARAVARKLGIPFYVANVEEEFGRCVVDRFVEDYLAGLTPNPCIACNTDVKFGWLLRRARALGAKLATGHYARVERRDGRWALLAAGDPAKDQSYFLHGLGQEELRDVLFPVGHLPKPEVRRLAARAGLSTAEKAESQEICFVPDADAAGFVEARGAGAIRPGELVDVDGKLLGRHGGIHRFTVGQRRGLGVATGYPAYVVRIDPATARVVVGPAEEATSVRFAVDEVRWISGVSPVAPSRLRIKVRHRHEGESGWVTPLGSDRAEVHLEAPVRGVAPGQAAVFYEGEEVVGGGRIARG